MFDYQDKTKAELIAQLADLKQENIDLQAQVSGMQTGQKMGDDDGATVTQDSSDRKQAEQRLELLYRMSRRVNQATDEQSLLNALIEPATMYGAFSAALQYVIEDEQPDPTWLELVAMWLASGRQSDLVGQKFYLPDYPFSQFWITNPEQPLLIADTNTDIRVDNVTKTFFLERNVLATAIIPFCQANRWTALLSIMWSDPHEFSQIEREIYQDLISLGAAAVENQRIIQTQQRLNKQLQAEIAERQQAEERLLKTSENAPGMMYQFLLRADGSICFPYISRWGEDMFGVSAEDLAVNADQLFEVVHPEDLAAFQECIHQSTQHLTQWVWHGRMVTPNHQTIHVQVSSNPEKLADGDILWNGVLLDVTEQKLAEQELQRSRLRYRTLFEDAPIMYVTAVPTNTGPIVTSCNKAFCERLGYAPADVLHAPLSDFVRDVSRLPLREKHAEVVDGEKVSGVERELMTREGQIVDVLLYASPEKNEQGELVNVRVMFMDVTARKQAEQQTALLYRISHRLNQAADEKALLDVLVEPAEIYGAFTALLLYTHEAESNQPAWLEAVALWVAQGCDVSEVPQRAYLSDFPMSQLWIENSEQPLLITEANTDARVDERTREIFQINGVESVAVIPLSQSGRWVGQLVYAWNKPHEFSQAEQELYQGLVSLAATALENQRILQAQRLLNQELEEAKTFTQSIIENVPGVIFSLDGNRAVSYISPKCEQLYGYTATELKANPNLWMTMFHPEDKEKVIAEMSKSALSQSFSSELRLVDKAGRVKSIAIEGMGTVDAAGNLQRVDGIATDISQRKAMEATIRQSEDYFRSIAESIPVAVAIVEHTEGKLLYVNHSFCEMFGYEHGVLIQHPALHFYDNPDDRKRFVIEVESGGAKKFETVMVRSDQTRFWAVIDSRIIHFQGKEVFFSSVQDITQQKEFEANLIKAKQAAESANRAKSEFLARMSHELRTPLNGILGYAQILAHHSESLTPRQQKGVDIIQSSGEHLLTLINDILDISKIEARRVELDLVELDLAGFLSTVIGIIRLRAEAKGLTLIHELLPNLPATMLADEIRLRQILINLLDNAVKFTNQGQVTFKVGCQGERLRFQVEDTGIGLAPDDLDKIFEPFEQVGSVYNKADGTGLGLAISRRLVKLMGSDLEVSSIFGEGSKFWFDLALARSEKAVDSTEETCQPQTVCGYQGARRKILVVDDKASNRLVLTNMLEPLGFDMFEAIDGLEGVERAKMIKPDLILMDIRMPYMDGFEATERLRQTAGFERVIIIAVSASTFGEDRSASLEAGCDDFIPKPVHLPTLLQRMALLLQLTWIYNE